jgi:hypothetical protein
MNSFLLHSFTVLLCFQTIEATYSSTVEPVALIEKETVQEKPCKQDYQPIKITLRHIESNGIGYDQGYTTLEGFFHTSDPTQWVPFLDLRGHVFNNGKLAANVGLGLRHIRSSRIWGDQRL